MQEFVVFKDSSRETIVVCSVTVGPGEGMALRQGYIAVQHMISLPEVKYFRIFFNINSHTFLKYFYSDYLFLLLGLFK